MGTIYTIALSVALGGNPGISTGEMVYSSPESAPVIQDGYSSGQVQAAPCAAPYVSAVGGIYGDELYPYDAQYPWLHGYFQEMPSYGGYKSFRPYNYKHVMSQSKTAAGWGLSTQMPYSQQFWHRYQYRASMEHQLSKNNSLEKAEYVKELARLKARLDFEKAQSIAQQQRNIQTGVRQVSSENNTQPANQIKITPAINQPPIIRPGKRSR